MADGNLAAPEKERRNMIRVPVRRSVIKLADSGRELPLRELSPHGLSFFHLKRGFVPGDALRLDLLVEDRLLVADLVARIVWQDGQVAGCALEGVTNRQRHILSEFVLESMNERLGSQLGLQRATDSTSTLH